jgi:hypothetical protein
LDNSTNIFCRGSFLSSLVCIRVLMHALYFTMLKKNNVHLFKNKFTVHRYPQLEHIPLGAA